VTSEFPENRFAMRTEGSPFLTIRHAGALRGTEGVWVDVRDVPR
jgi:hypothetical protein